MNKMQEAILKNLDPVRFPISNLSDLIYNAKNKECLDVDFCNELKKFLVRAASSQVSEIKDVNLLEALYNLSNSYDETFSDIYFGLLKTYTNLVVKHSYSQFVEDMHKTLTISLLDCDMFSLIDKKDYESRNLIDLNNYFIEFLNTFIMTHGMDVEFHCGVEDILDNWSLIDLRTFCNNYKSETFLSDYFSFLSSDSEMYYDVEKLFNALRSHFADESVQYQYIENWFGQIRYNKNTSRLYDIVDIFRKYFIFDPIPCFLSVVIAVSRFNEEKKPDKELTDRYYQDIISCFLYEASGIEDTTKYDKRYLVKNIYPNILKSLVKITIDDFDYSVEIASGLEKTYKEYVDERMEKEIDPVPEEKMAIESLVKSGLDPLDAALEAYKKHSGVIAKAERGVYKAYKKYKIQEDKVDSEATKVLSWMKKMILGDKRKEVIEGKTYTPISLLKRLLVTLAVFNYNKVAAACMLIVKFALNKSTTQKERFKVVADLEVELELLNEKIEDARSAGDNKAKYEMMRTRAELQKAIKKVKYGIEASSKASDKIKSTIGVI